jgi:uncharacterized repeat protein (TIGR01451 family)
VTKQVQPGRVLNGEMVTYTVTFSNSAAVTATLHWISDTLDPALVFEAMAAGSDVPTGPHEIAGALVWSDTLKVPPLQSLVLQYRVNTSAEPGWSYPCNRVEAVADGQPLGPAGACVTVGPEHVYLFLPLLLRNVETARYTITKSAQPTQVTDDPGQIVTYAVIVKNEGGEAGQVSTVYDLLPAGFSYQGMAPDSDVQSQPAIAGSTLTWTGPFLLAPDQQIQIKYRVTASQTAPLPATSGTSWPSRCAATGSRSGWTTSWPSTTWTPRSRS